MTKGAVTVGGFLIAAIAGWLWGDMLGAPEWGVTTITALLVGGFLVIVFLFAESQTVHDGQPMPPAQARFLAIYLVAMSMALLYLVFALIGVRFVDPPSTRASAVPALPEMLRPTDGSPLIVTVVPNPLVVDSGSTDLQIFGFNLASPPKPAAPPTPPAPAVPPPAGPTVTFAGVTKTPKIAGDQLVIVTLTADEIGAFARKPMVSINRSDGKTHATQVEVVDQTGELRVFHWKRHITREVQLLLLVIVAGALGSYLHAIRSLTTYLGNQTAVASWFWFYVTRPFVGMALAVVFYATIRGGFVAGSPADVKSVNPFGVFAIAALVGMFADKAGNKLAEIFDALFKSTDPSNVRKNPNSDLALVINLAATGKIGQAMQGKLQATGGTPPYTFKVTSAPPWLTTDAAGNLTGTPTIAGKFTVEGSVTDGKTTVATKSLTVDVT